MKYVPNLKNIDIDDSKKKLDDLNIKYNDETKEYSYYKTNNSSGTINEEFTIPSGTEYIEFVSDKTSMYMELYEISL